MLSAERPPCGTFCLRSVRPAAHSVCGAPNPAVRPICGAHTLRCALSAVRAVCGAPALRCALSLRRARPAVRTVCGAHVLRCALSAVRTPCGAHCLRSARLLAERPNCGASELRTPVRACGAIPKISSLQPPVARTPSTCGS